MAVDTNDILLRIVEYLLQVSEVDDQRWAAVYSLLGALIGAGAAIIAVHIAERSRLAAQRSDAIAKLVYKTGVISNGLAGINNHFRESIAINPKAEPSEWWLYVEECTGFLPPPEPIADLELRALAYFKKADLYSDLGQLHNAYRISYSAMLEYNKIKSKLTELTAEYSTFHRVGDRMVMSTEFTVDKVPLAPGLAFKCEKIIQQVFSIVNESKEELTRSISELNNILKNEKKKLGYGIQISEPKFK